MRRRAAQQTRALVRVLAESGAPYAPHHASRLDLPGIEESPETLSTWRLLMLETDLGRLDVLNEMAPVGVHADVRSVERSIEGTTVRILACDQLIAVKRHVARPKDLLVAEELQALVDLV
jgi:hypothetical protein